MSKHCFWPLLVLTLAAAGCESKQMASNAAVPAAAPSVGVTKVVDKPLARKLTVSSELVPFQEIDVYAKESGYVRQLLVDYGSHVKAGQLLAVLEIPELEIQLKQDDAAISNAKEQVTHAQHDIGRIDAQHHALHLQYQRLADVNKTKPGLVAQMEIDEAQGKDLAAESQKEASQSALQSAQSMLAQAEAKREHDKILFDYSKITAPFAGVVTQRFANLGALMQAGTNSSTQAMPLVRLSQVNMFRLVIPVPESYVQFIHVGDQVDVHVSSLNRDFPGKVVRFATDVKADTRTMHTEVDVPNVDGTLMAGLYAEASIGLEKKAHALSVPLQALNQENDQPTVYVVDPSNKIEVRKVKLGIQTATDAEIVSGLKEGETVVVSDRSSLKAGEEVHPQATDTSEAKKD